MTPRIVRVKPDANPQSPIRQIVRDELASLGGHLLSTYGPRDVPVEDRGMAAPPITHRTEPGRPDLATLGGYLLEQYGAPSTTGDSDAT